MKQHVAWGGCCHNGYDNYHQKAYGKQHAVVGKGGCRGGKAKKAVVEALDYAQYQGACQRLPKEQFSAL